MGSNRSKIALGSEIDSGIKVSFENIASEILLNYTLI